MTLTNVVSKSRNVDGFALVYLLAVVGCPLRGGLIRHDLKRVLAGCEDPAPLDFQRGMLDSG